MIQPAVDFLLVLAIAYYFHPETLVHQIGNRTLEELLQIGMSWKKEPYWVTIARQITSKKGLQLLDKPLTVNFIDFYTEHSLIEILVQLQAKYLSHNIFILGTKQHGRMTTLPY